MYVEVAIPLPLDKLFGYNVPDNLVNSVTPGVRVNVPFGKQGAKVGYVINVFPDTKHDGWKDVQSVYSPELFLGKDNLELTKWLSRHYACTLGEAAAAVLPVNICEPKRKKVIPEGTASEPYIPDTGTPPEYELTAEQAVAVDAIIQQLKTGTPATFLLHGVTASGKTEVYFRVIEYLFSQNRHVVYLLPEISLTPQFVELTQKRFGKNRIGVWHSRISAGKRYETLRRAMHGEVQLMLGARSAVFAPFNNLGCIIVDEEHEFTYKQDTKPYYHTREVAAKRAELTNSVVILGSATPSIESRYFADQRKYKLLELKQRVTGMSHAIAEMVDLKTSKSSFTTVLSNELKTALAECLNNHQQSILFVNRRGFASSITCRSCGYIAECPRCGVKLVYHRTEDNLQCHFCAYREKVNLRCPNCNGVRINYGGVGTEKVESEIKKLFPSARVHRMDTDTTGKKDVYEQVYRAVKDEQLDILIGTQMIAKGFDFPKVSLVGIISADITLYIPDFRSSERAFQLLTQVAGRAGRSDTPGRVILQTYHPEHYVYKAFIANDYHEFYTQELALRKQFGYPPFNQLARIVFRHEEEQRVKYVAENMAASIRNMVTLFGYSNTLLLLGPAPAPYARIREQYRYQLIIKGPEAQVEKVMQELKPLPSKTGVLITYDVDAMDML
ncbi:MAG: primosomal protein N' [Elusimicrobiota bacterium]